MSINITMPALSPTMEEGASCRISVSQNGVEKVITVANEMAPSDMERYLVA